MVTKEQKVLQEMMLSDKNKTVYKINRRSNQPDLNREEAIHVCEQLRKLGYIMVPEKVSRTAWVARCLDQPLGELV
jgi:hypothetical protein